MMITQLTMEMTRYYCGQPLRIQHFMKVHGYCKTIGILEGLSAEQLYTLEITGLVHDIGIKVAEEKYGSCAGPLQEKEGPPVARPMLRKLGVDEDVIDRVCFLVEHHHTLDKVDGLDYQILLEADFLVNAFEDSMEKTAISTVMERVFRTNTGKELLATMFDLPQKI
ncbi:MAG: HD domain-containing protein [Eubacteriales bacterium]